jgi:L-ribulose-5-phosphate 3-epimerase
VKKAIGDNLFTPPMTLEAGLAFAKQAGYDGVELWMGGTPWFQPNTPDADLAALHRKIREAGLSVANVANSLAWKYNVSDRDPAKRQIALNHVERQLEAATILGTDAILVVAGIVTEEVPYNEVYSRCVRSLQALAPKAAAARVRIGVENCNCEARFLLSPREFGTFLDEIGSPWVGVHLDVGNIHDMGFPEQWIEILGPRVTRIHVKDVMRGRGRGGQQTVYTNIFQGDNNWPAIRNALKKVQYDGWLIAETEARYKFAIDQQFFDLSHAMDRIISGDMPLAT